MAVLRGLRLVSLAVLMVASQLDFASAAVRVFDLYAMDLTGDIIGNKPDPYLKVWCGSTYGGQTESLSGTSNPKWSTEFYFPNCKESESLTLEVWDNDIIFNDKLDACTRTVKYGLYSFPCHLTKGTLFYTYELTQ